MTETETGLQPSLLEIGARTAGADTTHLWREVYGYDLARAALEIQLSRTPGKDTSSRNEIAGQLLIRPEISPPCEVVDSSLSVVDGSPPCYSSIPQAGTVITQTNGYVNLGAAFRFRGSSSTEVTAAIRQTVKGFRMLCRPV